MNVDNLENRHAVMDALFPRGMSAVLGGRKRRKASIQIASSRQSDMDIIDARAARREFGTEVSPQRV